MSKKKRSRVHPKYKTKYRVRNWSEYDQALVSRGDLTIWFNDEAISAWEPEPSGARGRPQSYSTLAIETALALRLVYSLPWRQTEGLLASVIKLMGVVCENKFLFVDVPAIVAVWDVVAAHRGRQRPFWTWLLHSWGAYRPWP